MHTFLLQMLLRWNKAQLLKELLTGAKALLLLTMPSAQLRNPEIGLDQSIGSQAPSLVSYVTASSGIFPGLLVPRGTGGDKKNKRGGKRKAAQASEQIPDEAKSREYKAFEAFTATHLGEYVNIYMLGLCRLVLLWSVGLSNLPNLPREKCVLEDTCTQRSYR